MARRRLDALTFASFDETLPPDAHFQNCETGEQRTPVKLLPIDEVGRMNPVPFLHRKGCARRVIGAPQCRP
jgi:hypothetical protein